MVRPMLWQAHVAERLDAAVDGEVAADVGEHVDARAHHLVVGVLGPHRARRVIHTPIRRLAAHHSVCARAERLNMRSTHQVRQTTTVISTNASFKAGTMESWIQVLSVNSQIQ